MSLLQILSPCMFESRTLGFTPVYGIIDDQSLEYFDALGGMFVLWLQGKRATLEEKNEWR